MMYVWWRIFKPPENLWFAVHDPKTQMVSSLLHRTLEHLRLFEKYPRTRYSTPLKMANSCRGTPERNNILHIVTALWRSGHQNCSIARSIWQLYRPCQSAKIDGRPARMWPVTGVAYSQISLLNFRSIDHWLCWNKVRGCWSKAHGCEWWWSGAYKDTVVPLVGMQ
jgi:hypothetical protein